MQCKVRKPSRVLVACAAVALFGLGIQALAQQEQPPEGMTIRRVEISGLQAISEAYIRRLLKTREDQPFSRKQVEDDVRELLRSRKFLAAFAATRVEDGQAVVVFTVQEKPTIVSVEVQGNKKFTDAELYELTPTAGSVLDRYAINRAREDILQKYKQKGYYYATVELDEAALQSENRVIYRIMEGPRVRVRHVLYEGNRAYSPMRLGQRVETKPYIWIFRTGELDEERAERDALAVQKFYRDEGYLDARVGYRLDFDPIKRADLDLVLVIEEGVRYRVQELRFEGNTVFSDDRLRAILKLVPDKFVRDEVLQQDIKNIQDLYGEIGYVGVHVETRNDFVEEPGLIVLRYVISERDQSRFARITIRGNRQTKDEVIRRELRFFPGEYYNTVEARKAEQRLREDRSVQVREHPDPAARGHRWQPRSTRATRRNRDHAVHRRVRRQYRQRRDRHVQHREPQLRHCQLAAHLGRVFPWQGLQGGRAEDDAVRGAGHGGDAVPHQLHGAVPVRPAHPVRHVGVPVPARARRLQRAAAWLPVQPQQTLPRGRSRRLDDRRHAAL